MKYRITQWLKDENRFADLWKSLDKIEDQIEIISVGSGLEAATLMIATKDQFASEEEAFIALFKQYLFYHEEWSKGYGNDLSSKEWQKHLFETWIPIYLQPLSFQPLSSDLFLLQFIAELTQLGLPLETAQDLKIKCANLQVVELRRGVLDYDVYAENDELRLIYSWGITH